MRVVGCDPDTKALNVALIDTSAAERPGTLQIRAKGKTAEARLPLLVEAVEKWCADNADVDWVYIEKPTLQRFGGKANVTSHDLQVIVLGVYLSAFVRFGIKHSIVDNMVWKRTLLGTGKANKDDIKAWVLTAFPDLPTDEPQDLYDATAIAAYGRLVLQGH